MNAVYPGTFDPVTKGHLDVIDAASRMFDKVYIVILENMNKKPMFTLQHRLDMLLDATKDNPITSVASATCLTVQYAATIGAGVIVRGLRLTTEYEAELGMAFNNKCLDDSIMTVFMPPKQENIHISSTAVRTLINSGNTNLLSLYLAEFTVEYIKNLLLENNHDIQSDSKDGSHGNG